jgi:hypothetical protein
MTRSCLRRRGIADGLLLYCNTFSAQGDPYHHRKPGFCQRLPRLFRRAFGITFDLPAPHRRRVRRRTGAGKLTFS